MLNNPQPLRVNYPVGTAVSSHNILGVAGAAVLLISSNINRRGLTIFNNGNNPMLVDINSAVSPTSYKAQISPGAYYEVPSPMYIGEIWAVCPVGFSTALIREFR